ncbi:hypothetical protein [Spirochaeta africana]|uniref:Uncharacterized protein n=1 Tax=Spirochaeta africana (strain ATCC 700263 / DSM 8902 / Z-7692) TaxID=889378 RepID=H9UG32_SPIAZ|nr:hypothetical protein [Spirochaeta africana]AFG36475.1 hypothetical protein Spiaf_0370 [Spirochaeta africana DSM 8902]
MPYCSECGVEVDRSTRTCPLCSTPIYHATEPPSGEQGYAVSHEIEDMLARRPPGYARRLAVQILTVVFLTPLLVAAVADWLVSGQLSWSLYVGVSMAALWVYSVVPILLYRRLWAILGVCVTMTGLLMWSVDVLDPRTSWFWEVGLPVMAVIVVVTAAVAVLSVLSRTRGANIAGFILIGIAVLCGAIDLISKRYMQLVGPPFTWSLIVAAAVGPVALFLLYYHYALSSRINLRKRLHL